MLDNALIATAVTVMITISILVSMRILSELCGEFDTKANKSCNFLADFCFYEIIFVEISTGFREVMHLYEGFSYSTATLSRVNIDSFLSAMYVTIYKIRSEDITHQPPRH